MANDYKPGPFEVKINCKIVSVTDSSEECESIVAIEPLGSKICFSVNGGTFVPEMVHAEGKIVSANLFSSFSDTGPTDEREMSVTSFNGNALSTTELNTYRAVGQYMGHNQEFLIIQSLFVVLAEINFSDKGYRPSVGEWVVAEGSLSIDWKKEDILDSAMEMSLSS